MSEMKIKLIIDNIKLTENLHTLICYEISLFSFINVS